MWTHYNSSGHKLGAYSPTDHLGSTLTVLDDQGAVLSEQRYLPFGAVRDDAGTITQTDFGYIFQRNMPDTGLMDYKARFYSLRLAKFIQPDTLVPGPANPQSWNRYSYVGNSPINFSDPTGHMRIQDGEQNDRFRPWLVEKYIPIRRTRFDSELLPPKDEKEAPWEYKTTVHWGIHLGPAQYINAPDFYGDTPNGPNICVGASGWAAALCAATIPLSFPFTVGPKSYDANFLLNFDVHYLEGTGILLSNMMLTNYYDNDVYLDKVTITDGNYFYQPWTKHSKMMHGYGSGLPLPNLPAFNGQYPVVINANVMVLQQLPNGLELIPTSITVHLPPLSNLQHFMQTGTLPSY